jgi:phenylpropionate dioxygenase-like ring-hydroxylating dioxygenase large terminal subunit
MARTGIQGYQHGLVGLAIGQISREIFVNEAIYQQELEQVFTRAWLFVGHESQVP